MIENFKKFSGFALVLLALLLGAYLKWETAEILVFALFIWSIVNPLPSWIFLVAGMIFLVSSPLLNYLGKESLAERSAVFAFYFLSMMVFTIIYEIRANKDIEV